MQLVQAIDQQKILYDNICILDALTVCGKAASVSYERNSKYNSPVMSRRINPLGIIAAPLDAGKTGYQGAWTKQSTTVLKVHIISH
jgi:hypothetical protein